MRRVIVESPYAGKTDKETERNIAYARACIADCLKRNEAPFASHLLYTQPGVLDDKIPEERMRGISAGFPWRKTADATIVYVDHGISPDMQKGIEAAEKLGQPVEYRMLFS